MNLFHFFEQPACRHLVYALLHTLWQGGAIALALILVLRYLPARRPGTRYLLTLVAQFGVLLSGLLTWAVLESPPPKPTPVRSAPVETSGVSFAIVPSPSVVVDMTSGEKAPMASDKPDSKLGWVPIVALIWLCGVSLMLVRATRSAISAFRLTRGAAVEDRRILDMVDRLRQDLGIGRSIRVVVGDWVASPAVLGLIWPTLVLPLSLMTGLQPEALRAILAHELAHIRRYDYAVNLVQMLIESLLFFNPAVWWLGRQARLEREACCDALAVELTGQALEYSRILADWSEHVQGLSVSPAAALAWLGRGGSSPLLERVIRVLRPAETPRVRVSWSGLLFLLLFGPVILLGLGRGTTQVVALAAQILAPAERLEKLKQAQAEFASPDVPGTEKATLKGTIHEPGGKPLSEPVEATALGRISQGGVSNLTLDPLKEEFSVKVNPGLVWLHLQPKKFAPVIVGPFKAKPGETVTGIDVVLAPGFSSRIRVVDEHNAPVAGAKVEYNFIIPELGGGYFHRDRRTDDEGYLTVPHATQGHYAVSVSAPGFQVPRFRPITFAPGGTTTLVLIHARPTRGIIVAPDGTPVVGAALRLYFAHRAQGSFLLSISSELTVGKPVQDAQGQSRFLSIASSNPAMATTDQNGRFRLDELEEGMSYTILVDRPQVGMRLVEGVRAGQEDLRWTIGPELSIVGTIKGNLAALARKEGKPVVEISQYGKSGPDGQRRLQPIFRSTVPVDPMDGGGQFKLSGILPGEITVEAGTHAVHLDVEKPETPVVVDLSATSTLLKRRKVTLRIVPTDGAVVPPGTLTVVTNDIDSGGVLSRLLKPPVTGGEATFDVPVPGKVSYRPDFLVGYWFKDDMFDVPPGDAPLVVDVKGMPAGAVVGRVFEADGSPAKGTVELSAFPVGKPPNPQTLDFHISNIRTDMEGRYLLNSLPIGGTYIVIAAHGYNRQISKPILLDGTKAAVQVDLRMAKSVAAGGQVLDPSGKPIAGAPVSLRLSYPQAVAEWDGGLSTDRDGRFQFDDLSSEIGPYKVLLDCRKDYQPAEATLNPGGRPVEIRLKPGHVIIGRVVDAKTGWPIPGVAVYAHRNESRSGERFAFESEGETDQEGRFRFSNLPNDALQLGARDCQLTEPEKVRDISPDQGEAVEIRVSLPTWSRLKPVPQAQH